MRSLPNDKYPDITPRRPVLRKLLQTLTRTDADFDAFCMDYFSHVHARFAHGMDRPSKVNLLLELTGPADVLKRLREQYRHDQAPLEVINRHISERETEEAHQAWVLREELERLYIEREQRRLIGQDTANLDAEIVAVKRFQRQSPQLHEGEVLGDRYRLLEVIGKGGFARVWQAYDREARRLVAVKVLHGESGDDTRRLERFLRGAREMKELEHPNIVRVLDDPAEYNGFHYFVMDYFPGRDLFRAISAGIVGQAEAVKTILSVGSALEYAHSRHLIHRDVKPHNVLLDGCGGARLTDFDLVWAADTTGGTHTGFLGTHIYVAPEQAENAKSVDARADIYSLGMTTLFVLYGKALPQRAVYQRALFIDELPCDEQVRALLRQATAIDPDDRPASISAFCRELTHALADNHPCLPAPQGSTTTRLPIKQNPSSDNEIQQSYLMPTVCFNPREIAPSAEHTSADMRDVENPVPGINPRSRKDAQATLQQDPNPAGETLTELNQGLRREPAASHEPRWIVQVEVCAAGVGEPHERRAFVYPQRLTFGRHDSCDIHFGQEERAVSSLHAELIRSESGYTLRDADSRNGLYGLSLIQPADLSQGPGAQHIDSPAEAEPRRLSELPLEVSEQTTEISLGPQGPVCRIRIGDVVPFADYLVTGWLGEGGMATVFVAQETTGLNRLVVLKLIAPSLFISIDQKEAVAMLQEEARIASQISHPNVVNIFRAGCYQGSHYIAMEYLRGVNLGSIQRQLARRRRRCPAELAAALLSQALLGLHAAHEAKDSAGRSLGIVHRDFMPTNIVCSPEGDVKLIDFGVASAIGRDYRSTTGQFIGKPAYASPEQIQRLKSLDRRSDVFAAGIILYELCVGRHLFLRDHDFATMAAVISEPLPPLTGVPEALIQIITSALSREPEGRPPTAAALAEQLDRFVLAEGGRYLLHKNIAQTLRQLGVNLTAPMPRTLVGRPPLFPKQKPTLPLAKPPGSPNVSAGPGAQLAGHRSPSKTLPDKPPDHSAHGVADSTRTEKVAGVKLPEPQNRPIESTTSWLSHYKDKNLNERLKFPARKFFLWITLCGFLIIISMLCRILWKNN